MASSSLEAAVDVEAFAGARLDRGAVVELVRAAGAVTAERVAIGARPDAPWLETLDRGPVTVVLAGTAASDDGAEGVFRPVFTEVAETTGFRAVFAPIGRRTAGVELTELVRAGDEGTLDPLRGRVPAADGGLAEAVVGRTLLDDADGRTVARAGAVPDAEVVPTGREAAEPGRVGLAVAVPTTLGRPTALGLAAAGLAEAAPLIEGRVPAPVRAAEAELPGVLPALRVSPATVAALSRTDSCASSLPGTSLAASD